CFSTTTFSEGCCTGTTTTGRGGGSLFTSTDPAGVCTVTLVSAFPKTGKMPMKKTASARTIKLFRIKYLLSFLKEIPSSNILFGTKITGKAPFIRGGIPHRKKGEMKFRV